MDLSDEEITYVNMNDMENGEINWDDDDLFSSDESTPLMSNSAWTIPTSPINTSNPTKYNPLFKMKYKRIKIIYNPYHVFQPMNFNKK